MYLQDAHAGSISVDALVLNLTDRGVPHMTPRDYIKSINLSGIPRTPIQQDAATDATAIFDDTKKQSQVVGSSIFSFAAGVDANIREAISDSALLAQLVANKQVPSQTDPLEWFKAYSTVLQNIGWTIQDSGFTDYSASGNEVEVNQEIITVMSVALGAAPAALAIISATFTALKAMQPGNPWLTIFSRESQKAKIARFQIGLVEKDGNGETFVSLCACLVEADNSITQALFFKFKSAHARFRANTAKVSLNAASLTDLSVAVRTKTRAYQHDYVSSILDVLTENEQQQLSVSGAPKA
jgi:hypothetical protein